MSCDVTILMPCLNEVRSLPTCIDWAQEAAESLKQHGLTTQIVISDNGSTDGSRELARDRGCVVVDCPERGYGNALIHGVRHSEGRFILMGDADGSYDFREGVPMIRKLQEGYDLCMGTRLKGRIEPGAMPWKNRYIGNPFLSRILNLFFRSGLSDAHCGLRAFTREAFDRMHLSSTGMEFASEIVVKAAMLDLKRTEIPITLHPDLRDRPPHLNPWQDGWRHLKFLLVYSPLWSFFIPAALMIVVGGFILGGLLAAPPGEMFRVGPIWFGDHWLFLALGAIAMGYQAGILGFAALALHSDDPAFRGSRHTRSAHKLISVEHMCLLGGTLLAAGIAVFAYVVAVWSAKHFGPLNQMRHMALSILLIMLGGQTFFSGFLFAIIGDRDQREAQWTRTAAGDAGESDSRSGAATDR